MLRSDTEAAPAGPQDAAAGPGVGRPSLEGLNVCVTGALTHPKTGERLDFIEAAHAVFKASVSATTDLLVVAEEPGNTKLMAAQKHGTRMMYEPEFWETYGVALLGAEGDLGGLPPAAPATPAKPRAGGKRQRADDLPHLKGLEGMKIALLGGAKVDVPGAPSMDKVLFKVAVEDGGGTYQTTPNKSTSLLVVGELNANDERRGKELAKLHAAREQGTDTMPYADFWAQYAA
ncbi:hypothetical protein HYH03_013973 [Edaphochlamys debaryana]|uniref:BRCT domain-containing protein n=1 Tax=Edaphochlamys debaryana TaxID=47281 RepID=A0A836BU08_9CHLO|nr:hypothetical protein HYH03_013973 [Edaphochlamys debaryana]|eukprot:KAG2487404.1 hypothetical protein HYH03_013973 [Edaphochlamys debaryana]